MVSDGRLVSNTTLPSSGGSDLCAGCEGIHFFSVLLHPDHALDSLVAQLHLCEYDAFHFSAISQRIVVSVNQQESQQPVLFYGAVTSSHFRDCRKLDRIKG